MNNREKLNNAFSSISDKVLTLALTTPIKKNSFVKKISISLVSALLVLCIIAGSVFFIKNSDRNNGYTSPLGWTVVYHNETLTHKTKTSPLGINYMLCINNQTGIQFNIKSDEEICTEMFGQLLMSFFSLDYSQHFSMFQEEYLINSVYDDFAQKGYTREEAEKKISETVLDMFAYTDIKLEFSILDIDTSDNALEEFREYFVHLASLKYGLDPNKIEKVCKIFPGDIKVHLNNTFEYTSNWAQANESDYFYFYKYDGVWYPCKNGLDDDQSIDILNSEKDPPSGLFKLFTRKFSGTVERIENGYAVLDDSRYFLIRDNDIKEGDYISFTYFPSLLYQKIQRISDGKICTVAVILSIEELARP